MVLNVFVSKTYKADIKQSWRIIYTGRTSHTFMDSYGSMLSSSASLTAMDFPTYAACVVHSAMRWCAVKWTDIILSISWICSIFGVN